MYRHPRARLALLLVLPLLVYFTGITILGPYAHGGVTAFVADFVGRDRGYRATARGRLPHGPDPGR